ncbi:uncharacterized protein PV09_01580 [Verruconis gallopava]|uniref:Uncharacterized protein n=1 Tax=Verruconis gallopava TaxID=253628 RepID=A0A0D1XXW5_9PEZI|nr:uncharacterized protein PV09_01580 [Verruconis gallopava]KIW07636.1 hypothetical protein PV09_01580 [Verruconis gallopava]
MYTKDDVSRFQDGDQSPVANGGCDVYYAGHSSMYRGRLVALSKRTVNALCAGIAASQLRSIIFHITQGVLRKSKLRDAILIMPPTPGALKRLWWKWKSLRLPWRKKWLVGFDLAGNTFWEFKDALHAGRVRRIVSYGTKVHFSEVKLTPQWIQWLRHARVEPPSINEQQLDEIRQAQMKELAARADARWAAKESALDMPTPRRQLPSATQTSESTPQDMNRQAQVPNKAFEAAEKPKEEIPSLLQDRAAQDVPKGTPSTTSPQPPKKVKEFTAYKLAKDVEQQPEPWTPKAMKRR